VHQILEAWGLKQEEVAFLGDSSVDQHTAQNAGVAFWAFKNPELTSDLLVPDFETLLAFFKRAWPELTTQP